MCMPYIIAFVIDDDDDNNNFFIHVGSFCKIKELTFIICKEVGRVRDFFHAVVFLRCIENN